MTFPEQPAPADTEIRTPRKSARLVRRAPQPLTLEPRFVFDGAAAVDAAHAADSHAADHAAPAGDKAAGEQNADKPVAPAAVETSAPGKEIVFIDSSVENSAQLANSVRDGVEVVMLDSNANGVDQITQALTGRDDIDAIHIISHGSNGNITLGNTVLSIDNIDANGTSLAAWGKSLTQSGDILLYGCDVGGSASGQAFIQHFAALTGADVAASNDITGSAALGGNWVLESSTGAIEAKTLDPELGGWSGTLETTVFDADFHELNFNGSDVLNIKGNGSSSGDVVRFNNVITIDGQAVDAVITTSSLNNATISTYDSTANPSTTGSYFQPNMTVSTKSAGGSITFTIEFYKAGTYTGAGTGTAVTLQNVAINSYDIDSTGTSASDRQYQIFKGFSRYELANNTLLEASAQDDGSVKFLYTTNSPQNVTDIYADTTRVKVYYDSITSFVIESGTDKVGSANVQGTAYFALDFSVGPAWTGATTITNTPAPNITYDSTGFVESSANDGSVSTTRTITLANGTFTGSDGQALSGVSFGNVPDGLTAVVTRTSATTATLTFTGHATDHADANDINNISVTFGNAAFTSGNASAVTGATRGDISIDFADPAPNTPASIGGDASGAVTEDASSPNLSDSGTLTISDPDSGEAHFRTDPGDIAASEGALGNLSITADGVWTYTVANSAVQYLKDGETKTETFTVRSTDGTTHDIAITITGVNDAASIGGDASGAVTEDASSPNLSDSGTLTISDADTGEAQFRTDPGDITASADALGSLTIAAGGAWTYTVANSAVQYLKDGETKTETFTVHTVDGSAHDIVITITGVNDAPVAAGTTIGTPFGTEATGNLPGASDVDGDSVTYAKASDPEHGTVTITEDGGYTYTPTAGYSGADSFTYSVSDGHGGSNTYTVAVTVAANIPAVFSGDDTAAVTEDSGAYVKSGALTVTDADGADTVIAQTDVAGNYGSFSIDTAGHWTYTADNALLQPLSSAAEATDTFTVTAADGTTHQVVITLNGVNDVAVIGGDASGAVTENASAPNLSDSGVLTVDDVDANQAHFRTDPSDISASEGALGSLSISENGAWTYTVANGDVQYLKAGETKTETFTVRTVDGGTHDIAITITGVNNSAEVSGNDHGGVTEDASSPDLTDSGTLIVSDADAGEAHFSTDPHDVSASEGALGSLSISANGEWTYSVANSAVQYLKAGETKTETFTVHTADGSAHDVVITIAGVNDAPEAAPVDLTPELKGPVSGTLPAASDVDGDTVTYAKASDPEHGSVTIDANGNYTYTPTAGYTGTDSFSYSVSDGHGGSNTYTVSIAVPANVPAHFAGGDSANVTKDSGDYVRNGTLAISDVDDAANLVPQTDTAGHYGTFSIDADGHWHYVANNNLLQPLVKAGQASDVFTVTAVDGTTHQIVITLNGSEAPPAIPAVTPTPPAPQPIVVALPSAVPVAPVVTSVVAPVSSSTSVFEGGVSHALFAFDNPVAAGALRQEFDPGNDHGHSADNVFTSNTGFPIVVIEAPQPTLTIYRGIADQYSDMNTASSFSLPYDAFAHTDPNERILLSAKLSDGRDLPSWLRFDAQSGKFEYDTPAGFHGDLVIKVTARDSQGREASVLFRFSVGDKHAGGRSAFSDQLRAARRSDFALAFAHETQAATAAKAG